MSTTNDQSSEGDMTDKDGTAGSSSEQNLVEQYCRLWEKWTRRSRKFMDDYTYPIPDDQQMETVLDVARHLRDVGRWRASPRHAYYDDFRLIEQHQRLYDEINDRGIQRVDELRPELAERLRSFVERTEAQRCYMFPSYVAQSYNRPDDSQDWIEAFRRLLQSAVDDLMEEPEKPWSTRDMIDLMLGDSIVISEDDLISENDLADRGASDESGRDDASSSIDD